MRRSFRLAAIAFLATLATACGGGGHAIPPAGNSQQGTTAAVSVPEAAARGVLVTVHLPLRNSDQLDALIARQGEQRSADYHRFLTPAQFRATYAPSAADLSTASAAMKNLGFTTYVTSQSVVASAPQDVVERAFGIRLTSTAAKTGRAAQSSRATVLTANRAPTLSPELAKLNATVSFSPFVRHVDVHRVSKTAFTPTTDNRYSTTGPYWFTDLKQAYGYPSYTVANGRGRTIAVVIDSDILDSDLALYFGHEALAPPVVIRRPVDGGPKPFDPASDSSFEASLDVQQSFGSASGSTIMLYGIPQLDDNSIYDAYSAIIEDNRADVVNSSFGLCELYYTAAYNGGTDFTSILTAFHDLFRQGNAQGITFVASSGDSGAYGCVDPSGTFYVKGVQNPADDPAVTGVGGTNLVTKSVTGSLTSAYVRESEFFDPYDDGVPNSIWGSGGGISKIFAKPPYQALVNTRASTRTVPDVSMHMGGCPVGAKQPCNPDDSSDIVAVGGVFYLVIGTSASSPDFAGLLAVTEQTLGTRLGNANYYVYALAALGGNAAYHTGIPGNNGYPSAPGYDYVTGVGTPHADVFAAQPFAPVAGKPGTPSNP